MNEPSGIVEIHLATPDGAGEPLSNLFARQPGARVCIRLGMAGATDDLSIDELAIALGNAHAVSIILDDVSAMSKASELAKTLTDTPVTIDVILGPEAVAQDAFTAPHSSAMAQIVSSSRTVIEDNLSVRWLAPVTPPILYRLESLFSLAEDLGVTPVLIAEDRLEGLTPNDRLFLIDFIRDRLFDEGVCRLNEASCRYYQSMLDAVVAEGGFSAPVALSSVRLGQDLVASENATRVGFHCPANLFGLVAPSGASQEAAAPSIGEAVSVLRDGLKGHLSATMAGLRGKPKSPDKLAKVLLIGAYGGEHIGDAAILGGVAFRVHEKYGATRAILMSQRPNHTRHLIPMIETPLDIEVRDYQHAEIKRAIDEVDAVVFAGGPLIDLPKQLVRHLYAASLANQQGKPFLMEGIGPGPFPRKPSEVTARRLASMASGITLRTKESAEAAVVQGLSVTTGHDPAFDYLATRPASLTRLSQGEENDLGVLFDGAEGRPVIGLNIRPIYHQYTVAPGEEDKENYTKRVEDQFERRLAAAMTTFNQTASKKPLYLFFSMNSVQFGLSDLKSAYRIGRHLGRDVDYRVWEADTSLDGALALIRRLDLAITMRFHATIFALSQGIETLGVDYRVGKRDKVAAVLTDAGKGDQCTRIDLMTTEWLLKQMSRLIKTSVTSHASAPLL